MCACKHILMLIILELTDAHFCLLSNVIFSYFRLRFFMQTLPINQKKTLFTPQKYVYNSYVNFNNSWTYKFANKSCTNEPCII